MMLFYRLHVPLLLALFSNPNHTHMYVQDTVPRQCWRLTTVWRVLMDIEQPWDSCRSVTCLCVIGCPLSVSCMSADPVLSVCHWMRIRYLYVCLVLSVYVCLCKKVCFSFLDAYGTRWLYILYMNIDSRLFTILPSLVSFITPINLHFCFPLHLRVCFIFIWTCPCPSSLSIPDTHLISSHLPSVFNPTLHYLSSTIMRYISILIIYFQTSSLSDGWAVRTSRDHTGGHRGCVANLRMRERRTEWGISSHNNIYPTPSNTPIYTYTHKHTHINIHT